jgi:thiol-disulfide isomerase/thioredoxin
MKKLYRIVILFNIFFIHICFIENSEYIKDISSCKQLEKELKNTQKESGMLLIYSSWCGHCQTFSKTYVKLAEKYNYQLFFYAMAESTDYDQKFKDVTGYPTIFFYKNGKFISNKGGRSFETLSAKIEEDYITECRQIDYSEINKIYNDKYMNNDIYRNLLIGFFKDDEYINMYNSISFNYLKTYIDFCFYCSDYEEHLNETDIIIDLNDIKENNIVSFNKIKGINSFYLNNNDSYIKNDYIIFIHNKVINSYEDINSDNKIFLLNLVKNKLSLIFVYKSLEQKNTFEDIANKLYSKNSRKNKKIINYFLFDVNVKYDKFKELRENGIYLIDKEFKKMIELFDLDTIEEIIQKNNMRLKNDVNSLIKKLFDNNDNLYLNDYSIYNYISLLIFVIIIAFYLFYKIFLKYIKTGKYTIYTELTKHSNIDTKIEFA